MQIKQMKEQRALEQQYNTSLHIKQIAKAGSSEQRQSQKAFLKNLEAKLSLVEEDLKQLANDQDVSTSQTRGESARRVSLASPVIPRSPASPQSQKRGQEFDTRDAVNRAAEISRRESDMGSISPMSRPTGSVSPVSMSRSPLHGTELSPTGTAGRERERRDRRRERSSSRDVKSQSPTRDTFRRSGSPTGRKGVTKRASARDVITPFHDKSVGRLGSSDALDEVRYTRCS